MDRPSAVCGLGTYPQYCTQNAYRNVFDVPGDVRLRFDPSPFYHSDIPKINGIYSAVKKSEKGAGRLKTEKTGKALRTPTSG